MEHTKVLTASPILGAAGQGALMRMLRNKEQHMWLPFIPVKGRLSLQTWGFLREQHRLWAALTPQHSTNLLLLGTQACNTMGTTQFQL